MRMRLLLAPRWIAFTVLVVAAVVTCLALGWWQWNAFHADGGSGQNLGYTIQWPFFAAFAIYVWWRLLRDAAKPATSPAEAASSASGTVSPYEKTDRPVRSVPAVVVDEETDPELAAYNRYLAELNARERA